MGKLIELVLVHAMPGRMRLKLAGPPGQFFVLAAAGAKLKKLPQVRSVDLRPRTGSIVVVHDGPVEALAPAMTEAGLALLRPAAPDRMPAIPSLPIPAGTAAAVAFAGLALYQIAKGRVMPPAITLAWYAASLASLLPKHVADHTEPPEA